jgi:DNA mismatch endonuclease (patch repair protein)
MDVLTKKERSKQMALVRSKDTKPELLVRRLVHRLGYRFRLHQRDLPGRPDMVFPSKKKIIFVHGCFWHGHTCRLGRMPKSRLEYWVQKIARNHQRGLAVVRQLRAKRWRCLVLWECQLRDLDKLTVRVRHFLESRI